MFGNDNGGDGGDDGGFGLGQLLFGLWLWRELDSGRIDAGQLFKALFLIAAVIGGGFLVLLAIASASVPRYDGSYDSYAPTIPGQPRRRPSSRRGRRGRPRRPLPP